MGTSRQVAHPPVMRATHHPRKRQEHRRGEKVVRRREERVRLSEASIRLPSWVWTGPDWARGCKGEERKGGGGGERGRRGARRLAAAGRLTSGCFRMLPRCPIRRNSTSFGAPWASAAGESDPAAALCGGGTAVAKREPPIFYRRTQLPLSLPPRSAHSPTPA